MRTIRVYHPGVIIVDKPLQLTEAACHHMVTVLRLKVGAALVLFNDTGSEFSAEITAIQRKQVTVLPTLEQPGLQESPLAIHLGQAISKGSRMDFVVQKATELGVHTLTPLLSDYGAVKLSPERLQKKLQHWREVSISACEQSGRVYVPTICTPVTISEWVRSISVEHKLVLHPGLGSAECGSRGFCREAALLVGAEGGLSEQELALAEAGGFQGISLGPRVLRTETAAIAVLAILQSRWGDMRGC